MKKVLITSVAFLTTLNIMAQDLLTFKGIPIEGSLAEFKKKLKTNDFIWVGQENNISMFSGTFTGKQVRLGVMATDDNKEVLGVIVRFKPLGFWEPLIDTYNYYKDLYTEKYGTPKVNTEKKHKSENNSNTIMYQLRDGQIEYDCTWAATGGTIRLSIESFHQSLKGVVKIVYEDAKSKEGKREKDLKEI